MIDYGDIAKGRTVVAWASAHDADGSSTSAGSFQQWIIYRFRESGSQASIQLPISEDHDGATGISRMIIDTSGPFFERGATYLVTEVAPGTLQYRRALARFSIAAQRNEGAWYDVVLDELATGDRLYLQDLSFGSPASQQFRNQFLAVTSGPLSGTCRRIDSMPLIDGLPEIRLEDPLPGSVFGESVVIVSDY